MDWGNPLTPEEVHTLSFVSACNNKDFGTCGEVVIDGEYVYVRDGKQAGMPAATRPFLRFSLVSWLFWIERLVEDPSNAIACRAVHGTPGVDCVGFYQVGPDRVCMYNGGERDGAVLDFDDGEAADIVTKATAENSPFVPALAVV